VLREDQQGGESPIFAHPRECLCPRTLGVPGQQRSPGFRYVLQVDASDTDPANLLDALQRGQQGWRRDPGRGSAQHFQRRQSLAFRQDQQRVQMGSFFRIQTPGDAFKGAAAHPFPHPRDQAGQHRDAGQHDVLRHQMRGGQIEQHAGAHGARPQLSVQPADHPEDLEAFEIPVAEICQDQSVMGVARLFSLKVSGKHLRREVQLIGQMPDHDRWHLDRVRQEGAEVSQRAELNREAEFVVFSPTFSDQCQVGFAQEEKAGEVFGRGIMVVPAVPRGLLVAQEFNRHVILI
jgi:hypothetical protein